MQSAWKYNKKQTIFYKKRKGNGVFNLDHVVHYQNLGAGGIHVLWHSGGVWGVGNSCKITQTAQILDISCFLYLWSPGSSPRCRPPRRPTLGNLERLWRSSTWNKHTQAGFYFTFYFLSRVFTSPLLRWTYLMFNSLTLNKNKFISIALTWRTTQNKAGQHIKQQRHNNIFKKRCVSYKHLF